jgi:crossover junction endodeoxyribonuclease RusA
VSRVTFELPYPPTINHYYEPNVRRGRFCGYRLGKKAIEFRQAAIVSIREQFGRPLRPATCRLALTIVFFPPDRRTRDTDNILKATKDAITHARVWEDDSLVDEEHVIRGDVRPGGRLEIVLEKIE